MSVNKFKAEGYIGLTALERLAKIERQASNQIFQRCLKGGKN